MSSEAGLLEGLELFYGAASNNLARVYARLAANGAFHAPYGEMSLSGFVRGPECEYGRTLPATSPLVAQTPGESLLAQAIVPDPCFWTPDVPSRYRVHVELKHEGEVIETVERELAIRNFGPRGKSLFLEGQRWVLRGVCADQRTPHAPREVSSYDIRGQVKDIQLPNRPHAEREEYTDLAAWREARVSMIVTDPSDELCREATRRGVFLVAQVKNLSDMFLPELRRLARFGAVGMAVIRSGGIDLGKLRAAAPNLVFAQNVGLAPTTNGGQSPSNTWADLVCAELDDPSSFAARTQNCPVPVIALRQLALSLPISEARAAIDDLQRDLAPYGDYAGYVV